MHIISYDSIMTVNNNRRNFVNFKTTSSVNSGATRKQGTAEHSCFLSPVQDIVIFYPR